jgi:hypothetical protein
MTRHRSPSHSVATALIVALAALVAGCSGGSGGSAAPVDAPKAREALKAALDGWKRGDKPEKFQSASPPMTVSDMDWQAGAKLINYQVKDDGKEYGPNLNVPVDLTIRTPQGKEAKKTVSYIVGTSPTVTVFRGLR